MVKGERWNRSGKVVCGVRWWGYLSGYHCGGRAGARAPIPRFVTNGSLLPNRGTTLQGLRVNLLQMVFLIEFFFHCMEAGLMLKILGSGVRGRLGGS